MRDLAEAQAARHDVGVFGPPPPAGPATGGAVRLFPYERPASGGTSFLERTSFAPPEQAFERVLGAFRPDVVHVHHLAGLSAGILGAAADAGSRVVLTVHDHALACPRGQRIRLDLEACPTLDRARCNACVRPAWIEAARSPDRLRGILGLLRPGEGRRLFSARDDHLRRHLDRLDAILAPSQSAGDLFLEFFPAGRNRLRVVPHGFWKEERPAGPAAPRAPFRAGYFGALLPSKGVFVLAEAARRLGDEARIVLNGAGAPGVEADLSRRAGGRLEMAGPYRRDELGARMAAVDAVLVPSLWPETFSIVVREAWTHRRPVLASATGALLEAAGPDGQRAGLVPPGDVDAWVAAIRRLGTDAPWRARLSGPHEPEPFETMLAAIEACYISDP